MSNPLIRQMGCGDITGLCSAFSFPWSSAEATRKKWETYYEEQQKGVRVVLLIEREGELIGYGSLLLHSQYSHFVKIPEIHDVWIDKNHRRRGFGKQLIIALENHARKQGHKQIGIGVGLYPDYGAAQRLYCRLGYIPDGHGITYKGKPVQPGESYPVDDDLILWLIKDF